MKRNFIFAILVLVLILTSFYFIPKNNPYDFSLRSEFGEQTTLKNFRGKKLIVYFGYTFCPDVCPATLALLSQTLNKIKNDKAYLLFISLDPQRDKDIEKTNEWLRYFYPHATSLIAKNEKELKKLTKNYGVIYEKIDLKDSFMQYSIAHSNEIYLIDEQGKFQKALKDLNPEELFKDLKAFLQD